MQWIREKGLLGKVIYEMKMMEGVKLLIMNWT